MLKSSNIILDIGANTGIYALIAAITNPHATVYAFEPVPRIFQCFKKNTSTNGLTNLHIYPYAVTNYNGHADLYIPDDSAGDVPTTSSMIKGHRPSQKTINVPAITIDTFIAQNNIPKIDLLKIDTESTEPLVLEGALNTIQKYRPSIICEVLKNQTESHLQKIMVGLSYKSFWICDRGLVLMDTIKGDPTYQDMNYIFIPTEKKEPFLKRI